jgi:hypothetical protein
LKKEEEFKNKRREFAKQINNFKDENQNLSIE